VADVFNFLTGYARHQSYRSLLVAPVSIRQQLSHLIDQEIAHAQAGRAGHIIVKVNSLVDTGMIEHFYAASQAGVEIDLIVRGMCCLRPGVAGMSERIRVRSIIGRYLEHSRIYWFANAGAPVLYMGSADLMERNLDRRVETLFPITDVGMQRWVRERMLQIYLDDTERVHLLQSTGEWRRHPHHGSGTSAIDSQQFFCHEPTVE
jgi:polyphosphate kinase